MKTNQLTTAKKIKTTFSEVRIGENFRRADGVNGVSYDKTSSSKAKICSLAGNMKHIALPANLPVFLNR